MFVKIIIFTHIKKIISKNVNGSSGPPYSTVRSICTLIFVFFALERNILRYLYTANSKKVVSQKSKI